MVLIIVELRSVLKHNYPTGVKIFTRWKHEAANTKER